MQDDAPAIWRGPMATGMTQLITQTAWRLGLFNCGYPQEPVILP